MVDDLSTSSTTPDDVSAALRSLPREDAISLIASHVQQLLSETNTITAFNPIPVSRPITERPSPTADW